MRKNLSTCFTLAIAASLTACSGGLSFGSGVSPGPGAGSTTSSSAAPASSSGGETAAADPPAGPPGNWTLKQRSQWQHINEELASELASAKESCGSSNLDATYAYESFRGQMNQDEETGLDAYTQSTCEAMLSAVADICSDGDMQKQTIARELHHLDCAWGDKGFAMQGDTFHLTFNTAHENASSYQADIKQFIMSHLN